MPDDSGQRPVLRMSAGFCSAALLFAAFHFLSISAHASADAVPDFDPPLAEETQRLDVIRSVGTEVTLRDSATMLNVAAPLRALPHVDGIPEGQGKVLAAVPGLLQESSTRTQRVGSWATQEHARYGFSGLRTLAFNLRRMTYAALRGKFAEPDNASHSALRRLGARFFDRMRRRGGEISDATVAVPGYGSQGSGGGGVWGGHYVSVQDWEDIAKQHRALRRWARAKTKTIIIAQSQSTLYDEGVNGIELYDQRLLPMILEAVQDKNLHIVYLTARPFDPSMIKHVLKVRGLNLQQIRELLDPEHGRVKFISLDDDDPHQHLAEKALKSQHEAKIERIHGYIEGVGGPAILYPFQVSPFEFELAQALGIPNAVYGAHPSLMVLGSKSGSRNVARQAGLDHLLLDGEEHLYEIKYLREAIDGLIKRNPELDRVMIKLNFGVSGEGNVPHDVSNWKSLTVTEREDALTRELGEVIIGKMEPKNFLELMASQGAAVEEYWEPDRSPSVQLEIRPNGKVKVLSTFEQEIGPNGNYNGAVHGADPAYRRELIQDAVQYAETLSALGVRGRLAIDFGTKKVEGSWKRKLFENNQRLSGTTHPEMAARLLTNAFLDADGNLRQSYDHALIEYMAVEHDVRLNLKGLSVDRFMSYVEDAGSELIRRTNGVWALFNMQEMIAPYGDVRYIIFSIGRGGVAKLRKHREELRNFLDRLEVEYQTGWKLRRYHHRHIVRDLRAELSEKNGREPLAERFRAFLVAHPGVEFKPGAEQGVVFHPVGYTVLGRSSTAVMAMTDAAERLLAAFRAEVLHESLPK